MLFDTGDGAPVRKPRFFFESGWFARHDFIPMIQDLWQSLSTRVGGRDILDWWMFMSAGLRQHLRGWNRNLGHDNRQAKSSLLEQITSLDLQADSSGLDEEAWALRYHPEEEHWRQRGRVKWALQGDANTAYFHAIANGRR
jgi:hypothetical protein